MKHSANIYDFDHTIYDGDASFDFIVYCLLRFPKTWRFLPLQLIAIIRYVFGTYNRKQVKQAAFAIMRVLPDPERLAETFWNTHQHKIKPWYLRQKQTTDLIVSASPEFLLKPIAQYLGILPPIATRMNIHTGKISGENCRAQEKVKRLQAYDPSITIASCYSDSASDAPLLRLAEHAYMVKGHTIVPLQHDTIR